MKDVISARVLFEDAMTPEILETRINNRFEKIEEEYRKLNKDESTPAFVKITDIKFYEMTQEPYHPYRATVSYEGHYRE